MNKAITSNLCNNCSQEYETLSNNSKFCSTKCRNQAKIKNKIKSENLELLEDYLICKWDNGITLSSMKKYVSNTFSKDKWVEYMNQYPNDLLQPISYTNRTCKHAKAGVHMKTDKFRKQVSQAMTGENNPNHKSKTTEEVRKSRSPFSKDFHKYKTDEDREKFIESVNYEDRLTSTQLEWWIAKFDGDIEKAIKEYKERQTTFSLDICIQKYGKEKGTAIHTERQEKWQKSLYDNGNMKVGYSKVSQELFNKLYVYFKDHKIMYATLNKEFFTYDTAMKRAYAFDYVDRTTKKVIEYNGDLFHANPSRFTENEQPNPFKSITSKEIWKNDKTRIEYITKMGFNVHIVWDSNYRKNPEKEIQKCLAFLREEN